MSSSVEKIKEKLNIADMISAYVKVEKAGSSFKAKCPFHNEKTPSFFISPDRGTYYCFGCGAKGDIFTFIQEFEGVDFPQALSMLAAKTGITLENERRGEKDEKARLIKIMEETCKFFVGYLHRNDEVVEYLKKRGLTDKSIDDWTIGYVPNEWRLLFDYLKSRHHTEQEMLNVGLIKPTEKAGEKSFYDTFRGRIMFPIFDSIGRPIGFSGRIFVDDKQSPKYLNSPDTILFNKSEVLYGFHKAKGEIKRLDYSILVEGQMDLIMSHQAGLGNTVASSGTALTQHHLTKLQRLSPRIMFAFDSDSAGFTATRRSAEIALSNGLDVKVVALPEGDDPASLIAKDQNLWKEALKNSKPIIDFYIDTLISQNKDRRTIGREIKKNVLPFVALIASAIEKAHYLKSISEKTDIKEEALWDDLKSLSKKTNEQKILEPNPNQESLSRKDSLERRIWSILFWQESLKTRDLDSNEIKNRLQEIVSKERFELEEQLFAMDKDSLIFEAEQYYQNSDNLKNDLTVLFINLEEEILKGELGSKMAELHKAEMLKDNKKAEELLKLCQNISSKLSELRQKLNLNLAPTAS